MWSADGGELDLTNRVDPVLGQGVYAEDFEMVPTLGVEVFFAPEVKGWVVCKELLDLR